MSEREILGQNVKRARQVKRLTQEDLAIKVRLAKDTISNIERGNQVNLGLKNMVSLCRELDISIAELFLEDPASLQIKLVISDKNVEALKEICKKLFKE